MVNRGATIWEKRLDFLNCGFKIKLDRTNLLARSNAFARMGLRCVTVLSCDPTERVLIAHPNVDSFSAIATTVRSTEVTRDERQHRRSGNYFSWSVGIEATLASTF